MAVQVQAGTPLAAAIQSAVQPKLVQGGWVAEETDTTLSEYVVMMLVNGKTPQQVISELGTDLLGVGEDDPAVAEFTAWLFGQVPRLSARVNGAPAPAQDQLMNGGAAEFQPLQQHEQEAQMQPAQSVADARMDDAQPPSDGVYVYTSRYVPQAYFEDLQSQRSSRFPFLNKQWQQRSHTYFSTRPSGPKAMRNGSVGSRGRGGRMLSQLNRNLDRPHDPLSRIKGAASGQTGRINSHAVRDPPRGPRGGGGINVKGAQRMMNGQGGAHTQGMGSIMPQAQNGMMTPQQQMHFLQMMEQQSQMMAQMLSGQNPMMQGMQGGAGLQANGGQGSKKSLFDRVDKGINKSLRPKRQQNNDHIATAAESGMEVDSTANSGDGKRKDPFDTVCRFNERCTVATCPYAHQSPAASPGTTLDLTDRCNYGAACSNKKCAGKHPSPAQRHQHIKDEVDCKFYPNCTNLNCPFRHPDMPPCRNGADCTVPGCKFSHSKITCRYNPCLNPQCVYKHAPGQRRGKFEDKVWTPRTAGKEGEDAGFNMEEAVKNDKAYRFAGLQGTDGAGEELIRPEETQSEQQNGGSGAMETQQETQIIT